MAKDGRTEVATPRKKQKAREEGNVFRSNDFGVFINMLSFSVVALIMGQWIVSKCYNIIATALSMIEAGTTPGVLIKELGGQALMVMVIIFGCAFSFQMVAHLIQVGFLFSVKVVAPKGNRMNPKNYFQNVFSRKGVIDLLRSILIIIILGFIAYLTLKGDIVKIAGVTELPWKTALYELWSIFKRVLIKLLVALFIVGAIDYTYQKWEYEERLKMTKDEKKREQKNTDGDPKIKARQRSIMINLLRRSIVNEVPGAMMVIVNPTHYAVAIRYNKDKDPVPRVVVKGVDGLALFMKEIAKESGVPIIENPPLARELYARVEDGKFVPKDLFVSIVTIMHYLMATKQANIRK
jgi:flagellar biosynthetic protein FlhB